LPAAADVTRPWLRGRAGAAVCETALEVLQAGSRPESVALFDGWVERLGVLRREPGARRRWRRSCRNFSP